MRNLLFTLLLLPAICHAQIEIGVGGGICKTNIKPVLGMSALTYSLVYGNPTQPTNINLDIRLSYILKKHYQFGVDVNAYEVSVNYHNPYNYEPHTVIYSTLYTPKVFANYIVKIKRFDIYGGFDGGFAFATEKQRGYCIGGNIGSNFKLSKHLLIYINGEYDYLSVKNKNSDYYVSSSYLNHTFNAMQLIIGIKYRI